eukprot:m.10122 g.10122  ORF g.10122 m.10122 type:complete len:671 (-) comp5528_c0_seq1:6463-8475(-)
MEPQEHSVEIASNVPADPFMDRAWFPNTSFSLKDLAEFEQTEDVSPVQAMLLLVDNSKTLDASCCMFTFDGLTLIVSDDSIGIAPDEIHALFCGNRRSHYLSHSTATKYGNNLLFCTMRIATDCLFLSRLGDSVSACLLSRSFARTLGLQSSKDYLPYAKVSWTITEDEFLLDDTPHAKAHLRAIYAFSPFQNVKALLDQLSRIPGQSGCVITVYNLHATSQSITDTAQPAPKQAKGTPPILLSEDRTDIVNAVPTSRMYFKDSLRSHLELLYVTPTVFTYINSSPVPPTHPTGSLWNDTTVSIPATSLNASIDEFIQEQTKYIDSLRKDRSTADSEDGLHAIIAASAQVWMRESCRQAERTITVKIGMNLQRRHQMGSLLYCNERLLKLYAFDESGHPPWTVDGNGGVVAVANTIANITAPNQWKTGLASIQDDQQLAQAMHEAISQYWQSIRVSYQLANVASLNHFWGTMAYQAAPSWQSWQAPPASLSGQPTSCALCWKCLRWQPKQGLPPTTFLSCEDLAIGAGAETCQQIQYADRIPSSHPPQQSLELAQNLQTLYDYVQSEDGTPAMVDTSDFNTIAQWFISAQRGRQLKKDHQQLVADLKTANALQSWDNAVEELTPAFEVLNGGDMPSSTERRLSEAVQLLHSATKKLNEGWLTELIQAPRE